MDETKLIAGVDIGEAGSRHHLMTLSLKDKMMLASYQLWLALAWRMGGHLGNRMTRFMARTMRCRTDPQYIGSCRWQGIR